MTLGNRIYRLRTERNLSQGALAERLGVSRQAVSKWENDGAAPELEKLLAAAELFGVTLDQLAAGEEAPPAPTLSVSGLTLPLAPGTAAGLLLILVGLAGSFLCGVYAYREACRVLLPCFAAGLLCLCTRSRAALWCAWAAYLTFDTAIVFHDAGSLYWLGWPGLLQMRRGVYGFQRCELNPWLQLFGTLAILLYTLWSVRREPPRVSDRLRRRLAASAWLGAAALPFVLWAMERFSVDFWMDRLGAERINAHWVLWRVYLFFCSETEFLAQLWVCVFAAALALTVSGRAAEAPRASLGKRILRLRTERGLSQGALAERLDVSRQSVSKWETGRAVPELEKLLALSRLFGVSLDSLAGREPANARAVTTLSIGQTAGAGLLLLSASELFVWVDLFGHETELLVPCFLLLGGALCLHLPKYAGLWCAWDAGVIWNATMRSEALLDGPRLLLWNLTDRDFPYLLLELAIALTLLLLTLGAFRRLTLPPNRRTRRLLCGGWGLWALLECAIWLLVYPATAPRRMLWMCSAVNFRTAADTLSLILLAAALTVTAAVVRARRAKRAAKTTPDAPGPSEPSGGETGEASADA